MAALGCASSRSQVFGRTLLALGRLHWTGDCGNMIGRNAAKSIERIIRPRGCKAGKRHRKFHQSRVVPVPRKNENVEPRLSVLVKLHGFTGGVRDSHCDTGLIPVVCNIFPRRFPHRQKDSNRESSQQSNLVKVDCISSQSVKASLNCGFLERSFSNKQTCCFISLNFG